MTLSKTQFLALMRGPQLQKLADEDIGLVGIRFAVGQQFAPGIIDEFIWSGSADVQTEERRLTHLLSMAPNETIDLAGTPVQLRFYDYAKNILDDWTPIDALLT